MVKGRANIEAQNRANKMIADSITKIHVWLKDLQAHIINLNKRVEELELIIKFRR